MVLLEPQPPSGLYNLLEIINMFLACLMWTHKSPQQNDGAPWGQRACLFTFCFSSPELDGPHIAGSQLLFIWRIDELMKKHLYRECCPPCFPDKPLQAPRPLQCWGSWLPHLSLIPIVVYMNFLNHFLHHHNFNWYQPKGIFTIGTYWYYHCSHKSLGKSNSKIHVIKVFNNGQIIVGRWWPSCKQHTSVAVSFL